MHNIDIISSTNASFTVNLKMDNEIKSCIIDALVNRFSIVASPNNSEGIQFTDFEDSFKVDFYTDEIIWEDWIQNTIDDAIENYNVNS